jgi:hypothetical protein
VRQVQVLHRHRVPVTHCTEKPRNITMVFISQGWKQLLHEENKTAQRTYKRHINESLFIVVIKSTFC